MKPIEDADLESGWAEHIPKRLVNARLSALIFV